MRAGTYITVNNDDTQSGRRTEASIYILILKFNKGIVEQICQSIGNLMAVPLTW